MPSEQFEVRFDDRRLRGTASYTLVRADPGDMITPGHGAYAEDVHVELVEQINDGKGWRDCTQAESRLWARYLNSRDCLDIQDEINEAAAVAAGRERDERRRAFGFWR